MGPMRGGARGGMKRPMPGAGFEGENKKPRPLVSDQSWGAEPIAQQPLPQGGAMGSGGGMAGGGNAQWYHDSW